MVTILSLSSKPLNSLAPLYQAPSFSLAPISLSFSVFSPQGAEKTQHSTTEHAPIPNAVISEIGVKKTFFKWNKSPPLWKYIAKLWPKHLLSVYPETSHNKCLTLFLSQICSFSSMYICTIFPRTPMDGHPIQSVFLSCGQYSWDSLQILNTSQTKDLL